MFTTLRLSGLFLFFFISGQINAQSSGVIIRPAGSPASQIILDAGAPSGYTSKTTAGFLGDDVANSKTAFKPIPSFSSEPFGDLRRGPNHLFSDFVPDPNGSGVYVHFDGTNFLFRMRLGSIVPGAKGYSILIDNDGKFGATGANADPNYQAATTGTNGNPGFEIEVDLFTGSAGNGVALYGVDGTSNPVLKTSYANWINYSQLSIAGTNDNGDPDFFIDFYIPLADLTTYFGVTTTTPLRMSATTVMSPQAAIGGPKSDIYGLNDGGYKSTNDQYEAYINAQPSFTLASINNTGTSPVGALCTAAPSLASPITTGATSVSGTWTKSSLNGALNTAILKIYKNGTYTGNSVSVTTGASWTVSGLAAVASSDVITAKALAAGESECLSSNPVTVSSCNSATKPARPVLSCGTFTKGLSGINRGTTNSVLWVVHVDNLSTNDLRNSTTDQTTAYFSGLAGSNWDFSNGCTTGSQMQAGSYKIYYTDNTGCNSEPLFVCVNPGKAGSNVAGVLNVPTITSPTGSVFTTATTIIAGTTQATSGGTAMTLYVDNFPAATNTASTTSPYSFSFPNLKLLQGQSVYITNEYNTGAQASSYCSAQTLAATVKCFTSVPNINADPNGQLTAGASLTGTSGEPAGTVINVFTSTGTLVASPMVSATGTWTTGGYTATAGTGYYANATNGTCGASGNTATIAVPSSVTSTSRCGSINSGLLSSSTVVGGNIVGSAGSPIASGTKVNVYEDGNTIGTYTFPASSTSATASWSITITAGTLYANGVITIGLQEGGTAGETSCASSTTVTCTGPLTPSYTQQSSNGSTGSGATVPTGGTMTYTITNLSPSTFYSIADAVTGKTYAGGIWTSSSTLPTDNVSITTNALTISGSYNGVLKATSVSSSDMCSSFAANSSFTVLPVTLLEFMAVRSNMANLLTWKTALQINFNRFEIEKSGDGSNFEKIGEVLASGSSAYSFTDNNLANMTNYYRLKTIDNDGKFKYSKVILLKQDNAISISSIRPNPFINELTLQLSLTKKESISILLIDEKGRQVVSKQVAGLPGLTAVTLSNLHHLSSGVYLLQVVAGDKTLQQKLLKM